MEKTLEELRTEFYKKGTAFFSWNSGKNTPNILIQLKDQVSKLDATIGAASDSSDRLAASLNRLTTVALWLTGFGLIIAGGNLLLGLIELCK